MFYYYIIFILISSSSNLIEIMKKYTKIFTHSTKFLDVHIHRVRIRFSLIVIVDIVNAVVCRMMCFVVAIIKFKIWKVIVIQRGTYTSSASQL